jgi:hypothetical protein
VVPSLHQRLLKVIRPPQVPAPEPDDEDLYANLLVLDRRKCPLLTHAATLYSVFERDVPVAEFRSTRDLVSALVERELQEERLPVDTFGDVGSEALVVRPARPGRPSGSLQRGRPFVHTAEHAAIRSHGDDNTRTVDEVTRQDGEADPRPGSLRSWVNLRCQSDTRRGEHDPVSADLGLQRYSSE